MKTLELPPFSQAYFQRSNWREFSWTLTIFTASLSSSMLWFLCLRQLLTSVSIEITLRGYAPRMTNTDDTFFPWTINFWWFQGAEENRSRRSRHYKSGVRLVHAEMTRCKFEFSDQRRILKPRGKMTLELTKNDGEDWIQTSPKWFRRHCSPLSSK